MELIATLASDPLAGDVVPGLGGDSQAEVRRRWTGQERRVPSDLPILAMLIYGKNEQSNPTSEQRRALLAAVDELKTAARGGPA